MKFCFVLIYTAPKEDTGAALSDGVVGGVVGVVIVLSLTVIVIVIVVALLLRSRRGHYSTGHGMKRK